MSGGRDESYLWSHLTESFVFKDFFSIGRSSRVRLTAETTANLKKHNIACMLVAALKEESHACIIPCYQVAGYLHFVIYAGREV